MPFKISNACCRLTKKQPMHKYQNAAKLKPFIGIMASESYLRVQSWLRNGCNAYDTGNPISQPLAFWTEQDVLEYIKRYNIEIAPAYGEIIEENGKLKCSRCDRTGCTFCGFGVHMEKDTHRFLILKEYYPKQYNYAINGGEWIDNPDYIPDASEEPDDLGWVIWNPKKIWVPNKQGLGMGKVFDMINEVYSKNGKDLIVYK